MSHGNRPTRLPLHGYQPLVVDEDCLTPVDCREAILEAVAHPGDWMGYVTQQERKNLEVELAEFMKQEQIRRSTTPNVIHVGEPGEISAKRQDLPRRGMFRAFARNRYADGRRFWYGDGVPPWMQPSECR